jgi:UDP-N-acetyl-D-mannosaminuronic acid dehydrogenase
MNKFQNICVMGLGYVGLPTAAILASVGHRVHGVDINPKAVAIINEGRSHIIEPDLDKVLQSVVQAGHLRASTTCQPADIFIIAVPTPILPDYSPDMRMVQSALAMIAPHLTKGNLVIIESTSPVMTTERAAVQLSGLRPDLTFPTTHPEASDILLAYCPERVLPGHTMRELVENARTIGGVDKRSGEAAVKLYRTFAKGQFTVSTARVAELAKLSENSFRDVNIAFANELSLVCDDLDIDVWSVISAANLHPRVNILSPGVGVGGHCIPVDPWFIVDSAPKLTRLIRTAREVNTFKTDVVASRLVALMEDFPGVPVALLGLAYKPDVDDLRESPAVEVAEKLAHYDKGEVLIVEPHITELPAALQGKSNLQLVTLDEALKRAGIVAPLVSHSAFSGIGMRLRPDVKVIDPTGMTRSTRSET